MRRLIAGLLMLLAWLALPAVASADISLSAPSSASSPYRGNAIPVSYTDDGLGQSAQMDWTYTGGGNSTPNYTWRLGLNGTTDFTFSAVNPALTGAVSSVAPFNGAMGSSLPDGTYTVVLRVYSGVAYTGLIGTVTEAGVTIDSATQNPTLTAPATSARTSGPINVQYSLPEAASGTQLTFVKTGLTSRVVTLSGGSGTAGSHSIFLDPTDLQGGAAVTGVAGGNTLPDGTYDYVVLSYQDAAGNSAATAFSADVVLDTVTQAATFTAPLSTTSWGPQILVGYVLPEDAAPNHAKLVFTPASGPVTTLTLASAEEAAGTHSFFLDVKAITATGPIGSFTGPASLGDGTYSIELRYSDLAGNPASSTTHTNVLIDSVTATPILDLPLAATYDTPTIPVSYTLGEAAAFSSTRLEFTRAGQTVSIVLSDGSAGTHTLTLNRAALASSSGVLGAENGTALPDGTYTVRLRTQDVLSNAVAETAPRTVALTTPVVNPDPPQDPTPPAPDPTPDPTPPVSEPQPPVTNGPLPTVGRLKLKIGSKAVKAKNRRRLMATFTVWTGAKTYRFTAAVGNTTKRGTCKVSGRKAVCSVNVPRAGVWKLTVNAVAADKTVLATGAGKKRVTFKHGRS